MYSDPAAPSRRSKKSLLKPISKAAARSVYKNLGLHKKNRGEAMRYESLVKWAATVWQERWPDLAAETIWASAECSNQMAQKHIKAGRRLRGKARYGGLEALDCPEIVPISDYGSRGKGKSLLATAGAWAFKFEREGAEDFEVIYACAYFEDDSQDMVSIAMLPEAGLETWGAFEQACAQAVRPRIRRRRDVYIIGGTDSFFDPTTEWSDVILPEALKQELREDMEAFFNEGVAIYRQLKLAPFRKLLLAGVPGTGKTMLCAAMARLAIEQRRVVVYVSGSDRDGASFEKIQRALQAVTAANYPVLMIVEELDAYLREDDKARVLNVLDGVESPNNSHGALLLATTNYPEVIDERIAKRPGRLDRIFVIPTVQDEEHAAAMLRHYMADQWRDEHRVMLPQLVGQPGAFVRESALHARMLAAHARSTEVTAEYLQESVDGLLRQMRSSNDLMTRRQSIGLNTNGRKLNPR